MVDILSQIEEKNFLIESLINSNESMDTPTIDKIQLLYSEKEVLIKNYIEFRKSDVGVSNYNSNIPYWNKRQIVYLANDKKVISMLERKLKIHSDLIKATNNNKRLLIYSRA